MGTFEENVEKFLVTKWGVLTLVSLVVAVGVTVYLDTRPRPSQSQPQLARVSQSAVVEPFEPDRSYTVAESQGIPRTGMYKVVVTRSDAKRIYSVPSARSVAPGTEVKLLAVRYYQHDTALMEFLVIKVE